MTPEEKQRFLIVSCHADLLTSMVEHLMKTIPDFDKYWDSYRPSEKDLCETNCMVECADFLYRKIEPSESRKRLIDKSYNAMVGEVDDRYNNLAIVSMVHDMIDAKDTDS